MLLSRTDDGGASFHLTGLGRIDDPAAPDVFSPVAVSFADPMHGWVVGSNKDHHGAMLYITDGKTCRDAP